MTSHALRFGYGSFCTDYILTMRYALSSTSYAVSHARCIRSLFGLVLKSALILCLRHKKVVMIVVVGYNHGGFFCGAFYLCLI